MKLRSQRAEIGRSGRAEAPCYVGGKIYRALRGARLVCSPGRGKRIRTDALDLFGTRLEKRYTMAEIERLLTEAGFSEVSFNKEWPYWCAIARA